MDSRSRSKSPSKEEVNNDKEHEVDQAAKHPKERPFDEDDQESDHAEEELQNDKEVDSKPPA